MSSNQDWQVALQEWLKENPKVMPDNLKQLREDFVKRFPKEKLSKMTLEEYAGQYSDENFFSFCHWLKFKTKDLGDIDDGGDNKFGVYWNRNSQNGNGVDICNQATHK